MSYPKSPFIRNPLVESQLIKRNATANNELLGWLCQTPTITTYRVNLLKTTTEAFSQRLYKILSEKYQNPPRIYEIPEIPEVVCISKMQLPPPISDVALKEIIVDSCCGAALLRGAHIYAPGVLAMESGTQQQEQVEIYADLGGKCKKGTSTRYESSEKLYLGHGVCHMQRYQLYNETAKKTKSGGGGIGGIAVEMKSTLSGVPSVGDLSTSEGLLQNLPSIVCVRVLGPQPGDTILDMCAAPGNKTTHIAEMMQDMGVILALDKNGMKVNLIKEKIKNNGLRSIVAFAFDATKSHDANEKSTGCTVSVSGRTPPFPANSFDRILLDAPCSALGNRPLLISKITSKMLQSFPNVQKNLLANAVHLLKPQGILVYSTCTVTEDENEGLVSWALRKFPQLQLMNATPRLGGFGLPDLGLSEEERKLVQRYGPTDTNMDTSIDTVGFFIAKFVKKY